MTFRHLQCATVKRRFALCCLAILFITFATPPTVREFGANAQSGEIDMALVLAIDVSYSVDATEFRLQMDGIGHAFQDPAIHRAIANGRLGRIAVSVMQWSSEDKQHITIPWVVIDSPASAIAFGARLLSARRLVAEGGTATGSAMTFAGAYLLAAPFTTFRRVIDVSSDGRSNRGPNPRTVRAQLAQKGITINGLAIKNEWPTLDKYFEHNVIGGPYHFVITAHTYEAYAAAMRRKLLKEIAGPGIS